MASEKKYGKLLQEASKELDESDYKKLQSNPDILEKADKAMEPLDEALKPLTTRGQEIVIQKLRIQTLDFFDESDEYNKKILENIYIQGKVVFKIEGLLHKGMNMLPEEDQENLRKDSELKKNTERAMKVTFIELQTMMSNLESLDGALKHLPMNRRERITASLSLQSCHVYLEKKTDNTAYLKFSSLEGKPLSIAPIAVEVRTDNFDENRKLLLARIVLEIIILLLDILGLSINPGQEAIEWAIEIIKGILETCGSIIEIVEKLVEAMKIDDQHRAAESILHCMCAFFRSSSASFDVVKKLLSDMSVQDVLFSVAKVAMFLVTLSLTGGMFQLAKFISFLLGLQDFVFKLWQLRRYDSLHAIVRRVKEHETI